MTKGKKEVHEREDNGGVFQFDRDFLDEQLFNVTLLKSFYCNIPDEISCFIKKGRGVCDLAVMINFPTGY